MEKEKIELTTELTRDYIKMFDKAFAAGQIDRCNQVESQYDAKMIRLGVDPAELHECVVEAEENSRPIREGVMDYFRACSNRPVAVRKSA